MSSNPERDEFIFKTGIFLSLLTLWGALQIWTDRSDENRFKNNLTTARDEEGYVGPDDARKSHLSQVTLSEPDGVFERDVFGFPLLCGMLNTSEYGHPETVDAMKPRFDSASDIFEALGDKVDPTTKVLVIKGSKLIFRNAQSGDEYRVDANGTIFCMVNK